MKRGRVDTTLCKRSKRRRKTSRLERSLRFLQWMYYEEWRVGMIVNLQARPRQIGCMMTGSGIGGHGV